MKSRSSPRLKGRARLRQPIRKKINRRRIQARNVQPRDYSAGVHEGNAWSGDSSHNASPEKLREMIHQEWNRRFLESNSRNASWNNVQARGKSYAAGFMQGAGKQAYLSPVPLRNKAAAVVYAGSTEIALQQVLSQLEALPLLEIVVVHGNSPDGMFTISRGYNNTIIAYFPDEVDADVGRALGAKLTDADTILFVDAEHAVDADILARFLWECDSRFDIALNDISGNMGMFHQRGEVEKFHEFLNTSLNREDLKINSLSTLPFAVSRYAFDTLGAAAFSVPVKAHAMAILKGLRIGLGGSASSRMLQRMSDSEGKWRKAAGDHVEAWREAMNERGNRLQYKDSTRNRSILGEWWNDD